ncbi:MAG: response regulator transcription factor [Nitrospinae bacterium]|nr:response regulator transcription factor [Nitrospinota bacterium]MCH8311383.1 response regulator transcription factor [Nitrospinota bacterium]
MNNNILLVDDDKELLAALELKLVKEGFKVETASDGEGGIKKIRLKIPDLLVLDVNMPGMSGMDVIKILRSENRTVDVPIIMLTARDDEVDRVLGFEFGADDYVTKPCNMRELILRIKSVLKRVYAPPDPKEQFNYGCLCVNLANHAVKVKNVDVNLTLTEFKLLARLIESPGKIKPRDVLLEQIWEYGDGVFSRTIDTHIQRLRSKLKDAGVYIQTVRGVGYRFQDQE